MRIDFDKLTNAYSSADAKINRSIDSCECMSEFTASLSNYIEISHTFSQEELAYVVISMENWITRKENTTSIDNVSVGDIFLADLGMGYKPEMAYRHPVVVLEKIGGFVLVVPTTTSQTTLTIAYHPVDNPTGKMFYRKVGRADGFAKDCSIIVSNIKTISRGRLIGKKASMPDVGPGSVFLEIKERAMEFGFPRQVAKYRNEYAALRKQYEELKDAYDKLTK